MTRPISTRRRQNYKQRLTGSKPAWRMPRRRAARLKAGGPSTAAMEEWKKDVENRVKIIQKKAMDLLDREEKLRKREEELRALAEQLGASR